MVPSNARTREGRGGDEANARVYGGRKTLYPTRASVASSCRYCRERRDGASVALKETSLKRTVHEKRYLPKKHACLLVVVRVLLVPRIRVRAVCFPVQALEAARDAQFAAMTLPTNNANSEAAVNRPSGNDDDHEILGGQS